MKIIDAQVHIWSQTVIPPGGGHRQVSTYTARELLAEMAEAGVDAASIHPPMSWDPDANAVAISQPDMLGETLRPAASDANHITAANS